MRPETQARRSSESVDDYLKAIHTLAGDAEQRVGSSALAQRLHVAPASITNMLQRLAAEPEPLIDYQRSRGVRLSPAGRRRALEIVRHHRLVETFLFQVLHYPLDDLHDEAERLEHFISERFEDRVAAVLGDPTTDPHGHCIPSKDGTMPARHGVSCACGKL
ncbi:metal-dependent transcriptional regulator [Terriglobus sp.]|uniref:metal-dependent transcriptional regulator n=1 Tax=Terriglobus sp. TaxID=1889013 RepID=UPI003B008167